jgi:MFS superfamily sulfate permease-like transporter
MLAAGGMSGSAVKEGAGARTQVANLVAWAATIVTLLFLTPVFASLPEAVLAALIIHAVWHILASRKLLALRREAPVEVWFGVLALAGVLFIDVLQGMMIGLLASLAFVLYRSSRPHLASLGRAPGIPGVYSDLARHPENAPVPGVLIVRLDAPLYYANALTARDRLKAMIGEASPQPRAIVFDAEGQDELDITSAQMLRGLVAELRREGLAVAFANVHAPVLERARDNGLLEAVGDGRVFPTVDLAVRELEKPASSPEEADRDGALP